MILIIEDDIEGKIGNFLYVLKEEGIEYKIAGTSEEAEKLWKEYGIEKNEIDVIILDYKFPRSTTDSNSYTDGMQNGVNFLKKNEFQMYIKGVSLIVNTSAERKIAEEALNKTKYFYINNISDSRNGLLHVCCETNFLSEINLCRIKEIVEKIKAVIERRKTNSQGNVFKGGYPKDSGNGYPKGSGNGYSYICYRR